MDATRPAKAMLRLALLLILSAMASANAAAPYGSSSGFWNNPSQEETAPKFKEASTAPGGQEETAPTFEDTPTYIQALVGQTVILPCNVADLGNKMVSWIRTRDLHILTSDLHTFTSDNRFSVLHTPLSSAWNLRIMGAKVTDDGKYECQVNTDPKMNRAVFLRIPDKSSNDWLEDRPYGPHDAGGAEKTPPLHMPIFRQAKMLGASEQFVYLGSTVTFTCLVSAPYPRGYPPQSVIWLHRGRLLSIQAERGGISMSTVTTDAQTTSRLTVAQVGPADAGNYTCAPGSGVVPATVALVVTDGERTEAMQRDGSHSEGTHPLGYAALLFLPMAALITTRRLVT